MRFPNKVTSYKESVLCKFCPILENLYQNDMSIYDVYCKTKNNYDTLCEFIDTLDCLFALGIIEWFDDQEVLHYVM